MTLISPVSLVIVPAILTPTLAPLLSPPLPISVISPPFVVLIEPPVSEIPSQAPVVPWLAAVTWIEVAVPEEEEKSPDSEKPTPEGPVPSMLVVAKISPIVEKSPLTSIPLPPVAPPMQEEKVHNPAVKEAQVPLISTP